MKKIGVEMGFDVKGESKLGSIYFVQNMNFPSLPV